VTPRRLALAATAVLVLLAAVPIVAFGIVPLFVRSTLNEASPSLPATASPDAADSPSPAAGAVSGSLRRVDPVHYGSGRVTLSGGILRFENVDIAGAPNMFVYLSDRTDGQPGRFTDLGGLRATNGSFNYMLPADLDLTSVRSVVVWCRAFSVTVTYAVLA
jgi:Electron transfer DM13